MPANTSKTKKSSSKRTANRKAKEKYWTKQIVAYRNSGKSAKDFCQENNVNVHTLTAWITRLNMQQNTSANTSTDKVSEPEVDMTKQEVSEVQPIPAADEETTDKTSEAAEPATPDTAVETLNDEDSAPKNTSSKSVSAGASEILPQAAATKKPLTITHGAITITANETYDKNLLFALLEVLLSYDKDGTGINMK